MALTPVDEIHEALREAYDPAYYDSLRRQTRYAFGEKWDDGNGGAGGDDFPDFPSIRVRQLAIGQSRRILTAQFVDLARNMYSPGDPEFPDLDRPMALVRKGFFLKRAEQGDWDTARSQAFLEGNGLGVGFLQVGFVTNPETGKQRVHLRHSPTCMTLWDPHEPSAGRAGYVCFVQNLPLNRAIKLYGEKVREHMTHVESGGRKIRTVRIFEYYDLGLARWEPTQCIIPGKMGNEPIKRLASPWKSRLPMAFYEHFVPPMMARPIGRIPLMMPTQEAINEIEAYLRTCSQKRAIDYIDTAFVNPQDVTRVENGTSNVIRLDKPLPPGATPVTRIPAEQIGQTAMEYMQYLQSQFNEDSGTTEYDRGGKPEGALTAYEVNSIQSGNAKQGGWTDKQSAKFAVRTVEVAEMGALIADTDPIELNVLGHQLTFNDSSDPGSDIAGFLRLPTRVLVSEESLRKQDQLQEGAVRIQQLQALNAPIPLVGPVIAPAWYAEQMLQAIGETDTTAALAKGDPDQAGVAPQVGTNGQPVSPQTGAASLPAGATPASPPQPQGPPV